MKYVDLETMEGREVGKRVKPVRKSGIPRAKVAKTAAIARNDPQAIHVDSAELALVARSGERLSSIALLSRHRLAIAGRVQTLIDRRGWSLSRAAKECGIAKGHIWGMLRNERMPSILMIERLELTLGPILTIAGRYDKQLKPKSVTATRPGRTGKGAPPPGALTVDDPFDRLLNEV